MITTQQRRLIVALFYCSMLPGSWDKRFVCNLHVLCDTPDVDLTNKQKAQLVRLAHKYRRQIGERRLSEILFGTSVELSKNVVDAIVAGLQTP